MLKGFLLVQVTVKNHDQSFFVCFSRTEHSTFYFQHFGVGKIFFILLKEVFYTQQNTVK